MINTDKKHTQNKKSTTKNKKPFFGVKEVVDNDDSLLCFLHKDKLYDLNYIKFAECKRVKEKPEAGKSEGYARYGRYIYKNGILTGKIKTDRSTIIIAILFFLFLISLGSLFLLAYEKKDATISDITVVDTDGVWTGEGSIKIFGDEKIKPGDKGRYMFMINNPNAVKLKCAIEFKTNYENGALLPNIGYTVTSEGRALDKRYTEQGFEVKDVIIDKNCSRSFYVEWEWPSDGDDDNDTLAGLLGGKYSLTIELSAEEV